MNAYEFSTNIKNRIIELPQNYPYASAKNVRVIILIDENGKNDVVNQEESNKEKIIDLFEEASKRNVFSSLTSTKEIMDWQKQQRDEWE